MIMQLTYQNKVNMTLNLNSPGAKGESIKRTILNQETGMLSVEYMNGTIEDLGVIETVVAAIQAMNTAIDKAGIATTKATEAENSAISASNSKDIAITKAGEASSSADNASISAGIATTKANEASASEETASAQAIIATTQAGISTEKAGIATEQAKIAIEKATVATTQAGIATSKAGEADTSKTTAQQALADLIAMLGNEVATLVDGKLNPSQIPAISINDTFPVANTNEMLLLDAQKGDVAIIVANDIVTDSYILATDEPSVLVNWKKLGVSYVAEAGHALNATNAVDSQKINGNRLVTYDATEFETAVKDADTFYFVFEEVV